MWNGGSTELQVMKPLEPSSCQSSVRLFVRVPTDDANCCYQFFRLISGASAAQCELAKRATRQRCASRLSDDKVSNLERKKKEVEIVGIAYLFLWESSQFIGLGSQISVLILGIRYVFPY